MQTLKIYSKKENMNSLVEYNAPHVRLNEGFKASARSNFKKFVFTDTTVFE